MNFGPYGPGYPDVTYVPHAYPEALFDTGEVRLNYAATEAWLSAYAPPGMIRGAYYEDAPLFSSETRPPFGQGMSQTHGPMFQLVNRYLGDQWSVGDWHGLQRALARDLPPEIPQGLAKMAGRSQLVPTAGKAGPTWGEARPSPTPATT
jgi:hypothetical protein